MRHVSVNHVQSRVTLTMRVELRGSKPHLVIQNWSWHLVPYVEEMQYALNVLFNCDVITITT